MKAARLVLHPLGGVPPLRWRGVQMVAQLVRHLKEAAERMRQQVQEATKLLLRTLDGVILQLTRLQSRSQVELVFGPLTFSVASGVILQR